MDYRRHYTAFHEKSHSVFAGLSIMPHVDDIVSLVERYKPQTLLDFGSGKGYQYTAEQVHMRWGGIMPTLYDIGVAGIDKMPKERFDGVICTDVMEHIAIDDVKPMLAEIFRHARMFVFLSISTRLAKKSFDDGTNVHLTVKPAHWWDKKVRIMSDGKPYLVRYVD
jgi:hypothetical protein